MDKIVDETKVEDPDDLKVLKLLLKEYLQNHNPLNDIFYHCMSCMACITPTQNLSRCSGCQLVTYCDRVCQKDDWKYHKDVCREFPVIEGRGVLYTTGPWGEHLTKLRDRAARLPKHTYRCQDPEILFQNPRVCHNCWENRSDKISYCRCTSVSYCNDKCSNEDMTHKEKCKHFRQVLRKFYTMSIFQSFHNASERLSEENNSECSIYNQINLTIHVIDSSPIFDTRAWEALMSKFPKLKKLNVIFVLQSEGKSEWFILNNPKALKNTSKITYSVHEMQYHMFYSSVEYTEPDVVVIFENKYEMDLRYEDIDGSSSEPDDENVFHSKMSYQNMLSSPKTVLILMDSRKEWVINGANFVNKLQPVVQLVPPQVNPMKNIIANEEPDMDNGCLMLTEKGFVTCLIRK